MSTKTRLMKPADKPAIMEILRATPEFKPSEVEVAQELIDSYLQDSYRSGYHILVAEVGGLVSGYVCYGPTPLTEGTWDIYWIAVARREQSRGIGSALMESAESEIREAEGRLAIVETSSQPAYEKTRRFYLNHGYELVGTIPDFYEPGDDKLMLQKRLGRPSGQNSPPEVLP